MQLGLPISIVNVFMNLYIYIYKVFHCLEWFICTFLEDDYNNPALKLIDSTSEAAEYMVWEKSYKFK